MSRVPEGVGLGIGEFDVIMGVWGGFVWLTCDLHRFDYEDDDLWSHLTTTISDTYTIPTYSTTNPPPRIIAGSLML